jgi:hypothetical protein
MVFAILFVVEAPLVSGMITTLPSRCADGVLAGDMSFFPDPAFDDVGS